MSKCPMCGGEQNLRHYKSIGSISIAEIDGEPCSVAYAVSPDKIVEWDFSYCPKCEIWQPMSSQEMAWYESKKSSPKE